MRDFKMPASYYEPPEYPECPECEQAFDSEECAECGYKAPTAEEILWDQADAAFERHGDR